MNTQRRIDRLIRRHGWDERPVFCFTSDVDWASEYVLQHFFELLFKGKDNPIKPTIFCTNESLTIAKEFNAGRIDRGIHPNFLPDSDHGKNY